MATLESRRRLLLAAVFYTNFLSLACQVIWVRKLSFLFGSTAGVFATVLTVFLLGLAFGALIAGRAVDKSGRPWRLLGNVLTALGAYCAISLPLFELARGFYLRAFPNDLSPLAAASWKFVIVLVILLPPTLAIGAMFPIAVRILSRNLQGLGGDVSLIYGLDTIGAAAGALLGGFLLVPHLGLSRSTWLLGAIAVGIGLTIRLGNYEGSAAIDPARAAQNPKAKEKKGERKGDKRARVDAPAEHGGAPASAVATTAEIEVWPAWKLGAVLGTFFFSGAAALLLETGWNRLFYLMSGTSVYSLASVLTGFLMGIGLGSLWMRKRIDRADRVRDPMAAVALCYALTALGGVLVFRSGGLFERIYMALFGASSTYFGFQLGVSFAVGAIVFLATVAMGANFPLVAKVCSRVAERRGFSVGQVFFWNTLGAVLGAFLGEFFLLPRWGFEGLLFATLAIYALGTAVFLALSNREGRLRPMVISAVLLAVAFVLSPLVVPFEPPVHAAYYHGLRMKTYSNFRAAVDQMKVIDRRQGFYGQVDVVETGGYRLLKHNGKTDASTSVADNQTQILLGHLPLFFHRDPKTVLAIGLGGGATLRALVHHPDLSEITMVEIDPLVTETARRFFGEFNGGALEDPRVRVVTNDGRNYVDSSKKKYDVITSEPPNIWVAGVSGLFTQEFYRSAQAHLNPGGILCQWMPVYEMREEDFKTTLATIRSVFPNLAFWAIGSDVALVASNEPLTFDSAAVERRLAFPGVTADLIEIGRTPAEILALLAKPDIPNAQLPGFLSSITTLNRDDRPILEFNTARNLFTYAKER